MAALTSKEALALAQLFLDASHALHTYGLHHYDDLQPQERKQIKEQATRLLNQASRLVTRAVGLDLDAIQGGLAGLKAATAQAKDAIATIQKTKDVITLAASLVTLCAAVGARDLKAIGAALDAMKNVLAAR